MEPGIGEKFVGFECATGMHYNGQPMDLRPSMGAQGIEFSFTDTAIFEKSFEILRAESVQVIDNGIVAVKIPYDLQGCGRQFSSITFTDQASAQNPGFEFVYGVRARWEDTDENLKRTDLTNGCLAEGEGDDCKCIDDDACKDHCKDCTDAEKAQCPCKQVIFTTVVNKVSTLQVQ
jgi:hypothetical protein